MNQYPTTYDSTSQSQQHSYDPSQTPQSYDVNYFQQQHYMSQYQNYASQGNYTPYDAQYYNHGNDSTWSYGEQTASSEAPACESRGAPLPPSGPPPSSTAPVATAPPPPEQTAPPPPPPPSMRIPPPPPAQPTVKEPPSAGDGEVAYSPSMAASNESDDETPPPPSAAAAPAPPKITLEEMRLRESRDREEHTRRIEAENRRKRKFVSGAGRSGGSLKKVIGLSAFSADEDPEEESGTSNGGAAGSAARGGDGGAGDGGAEERAVVTKTAMWVADNEDKLAALIENSKGNTKLRFLNEPHSPAGRLFAEELDKMRALRKVREVCGEDDGAPLASPEDSFSGQSSGITREDMQRAGREAVLLAMGVSRAGSGAVVGSPPFVSPVVSTVAVNEAGGGLKKERRRNRWGPPQT